MSTNKKAPLLLRLVKWGTVAAIAVAVLIWPVKALLASQAQHVLLIAPHQDAIVVKTNEALFSADGLSPEQIRSEVVQIYGTPLGEEDLLFVDEATFIRPKQVAGLTLFPKADDANPLKMDTINWAVPKISIGAAIVAMLLLVLGYFLRKRSGPTAHV